MLLESLFEDIKRLLKSHNLNTFDMKNISFGIQFKISSKGQSGLLRIYQNKKGNTKYDFSQMKNDDLRQKVQLILQDSEVLEIPTLKDYGYPIIGTDEAGKGDYFGPLVSAGVFLEDESEAKKLISVGVKDSKELNDKQNLNIAEKIKKICKYHFSVIEISPKTYNHLYSQFKKENKNLNTLLAWAHAKAIEDLLSRVQCNKAVIDQFANERYLLNRLQERGKKIEIIQVHRAEENIAVAAASILARARFLEKIGQLSEEYKIKLPKGASLKVIKIAKQFVDKFGKERLVEIAKVHFKTTKSI